MDDAVRAWVEREAGGRIVHAERPPMGGSRDLYLIDVEGADGETLPLVLRLESGGTFIGTPISLHREAAVYRALAGRGIPIPQLVAFKEDGSALLVSRVPGTPDFHDLDADTRERAYADFVRALASIHNLDDDALGLVGFERPKTPEDHARLDLGVWAELCDAYVPEPDPVVLYARAWLDANAPDRVQRTVLVQGDTGPGNFLSENGRVTGIVDWEFAHIGDPMDDLAWLEYRRQVFAPDLDPAPHLDAWARQTGLRIDPRAIDYYGVAVYYRCAVTTSLAVARGGGSRGFAPYVLQTARYLTTLGERLSRVTGHDAPLPLLPAPDDSPRSSWFEHVREGIREVVRTLDDALLRERTRNLQILLQYLRAFDAAGPTLVAADADDRRSTLGLDPTDDAALRARALEAGAAGDATMLGYLRRRQHRESALWGRLMERGR